MVLCFAILFVTYKFFKALQERLGCTDKNKRQRLLEYIRDFLLLNNTAIQPISMSTRNENIESAHTSSTPLPLPGLSRIRLTAIVDSKGAIYRRPTREAVLSLKHELIDLLAQPGLFLPEEKAITLYFAAGDINSDIAEHAVLAIRRGGADIFTPNITEQLLRHISLSPSSPSQRSLAPDERRQPLSTRVRSYLATRLIRSIEAPKMVLPCLTATFSCVYENQGDDKYGRVLLFFCFVCVRFEQPIAFSSYDPSHDLFLFEKLCIAVLIFTGYEF